MLNYISAPVAARYAQQKTNFAKRRRSW